MRTASTVTACLLSCLLLAQDAAAQDNLERVGDWYYLDAKDALIDTDRSAAITLTPDRNLAFGVRCTRDGRTQAVVFLRSPMDQLNMLLPLENSGEASGEVEYRFDDRAPAEPDDWSYQTHDGVLVASSDESRRILEGSREHRNIEVRVFNADRQVVRTDVLSLTGAAGALDRLSCVG
jgi:hypothetical protein